jgi:hypothetical protein
MIRQGQRHLFNGGDPQRRQCPAQNRIAHSAKHNQHNQTTQITAAKPDQRAEGAGADQRHAKAKHQRAKGNRQPGKPRGNICRAQRIEPANRDEKLCPGQSNAQ